MTRRTDSSTFASTVVNSIDSMLIAKGVDCSDAFGWIGRHLDAMLRH